jgi:hypothetical protein
VLVTRGDVDMRPIIAALPYGEIVVWDNSKRPSDAKVFGRYLGIAEAKNPVIYVQDDDCIVNYHDLLLAAYEPGVLVGSMPEPNPQYRDTTLLGWGALFDRDMPQKAFDLWATVHPIDDYFREKECEYAFPMLSRTKTVYATADRIIAGERIEERPNRTWKRPDHYLRTFAALDKARKVRDILKE